MISFISIIVNLTTTIKDQGKDIEYLKKDNIDFKLQIKDLYQQQNQQYNTINSKLTDILVSLQNKENKKWKAAKYKARQTLPSAGLLVAKPRQWVFPEPLPFCSLILILKMKILIIFDSCK